MELSHYQGQQQTQSPMASAHIAQTMTLLYMTSTELLQTIDVELSKNPALELINERRCPMCGRKLPPEGPCPICSQPKTLEPDETIVLSLQEMIFIHIKAAAHHHKMIFEKILIPLPTLTCRPMSCSRSRLI